MHSPLLLLSLLLPASSFLLPPSSPPSLPPPSRLLANKDGSGIGRAVLDTDKAISARPLYDMVLVHRIMPVTQTESGLHIGTPEMPKLQLARVLAVGPGLEEENGLVQNPPNVRVGELVMLKNPWGIGPKDEETPDGRKLSYIRAQDVAGVFEGGEVLDSEVEETSMAAV